MSTVQPTYVNHAHLPGTSRVPSNIEAVLTAALLELANKIDKNKAMHHGASEFSEENTYSAGFFVWYTDTSVPENSGLYICKEDVTTPGPWTGSANWTSMNSVSTLFTSANTSLMGVARYGTASAAADRKVATIVVTSETGAVPLPTPTSGAVTDVVVLLDCRGVAEIPAGLTFTGNILWSGGSAVAPVAGKMMAYGFTCDGTSQASSSFCYVGNGITCG